MGLKSAGSWNSNASSRAALAAFGSDASGLVSKRFDPRSERALELFSRSWAAVRAARPGPPPAPLPRAPFTRSAALEAIGSCSTWSELFEAGNRALCFDRSAWGDALDQCAGALALWQRCAFLVQARSPIELGSAGEGATLLCDPLPAKQASFLAAKATLRELAAPLPAEDPKDRPRGAPATPLHAAAARVDEAIGKLMEGLRGGARALAFVPGNPAPKGEETNFLVGTAAWSALAHVDDLLDAPFKEPCLSWEALASLGGGDAGAKPSHASRLDRAAIELAWDDLLSAGEFAYVACGPVGGLAQGAAETRAVALRARSMSAELAKSGIASLGLGGLGVSVNAAPVGVFATGAFEYSRFDLVFRAPFMATALHHEWTHALERMARRSGEPRARAAWDAFQAQAQSVAQDPHAFQGELAYSASQLAVARRGMAKALGLCSRRRLSKSALRSNVPRGVAAMEGLLARRADGAPLDEEAAAKALEALCLGAGGPLPKVVKSAARWLGSALVFDAALRRAGAAGASSFMAVASALDAARGPASGYWRDTCEVHARCGEARFAHLVPEAEKTGAGRLKVGSSVATTHPMGGERADVAAKFDAMLAECAPMVEAALRDRRRMSIDMWRAPSDSAPRQSMRT